MQVRSRGQERFVCPAAGAESGEWRADRRVECSLRHVIREGVIRPIRSVRPGGERRLGLFRARRPLQEDSVYYHNCAEARAKGVTPIYRGQPGYRPKLDRDGDGIACERR